MPQNQGTVRESLDDLGAIVDGVQAFKPGYQRGGIIGGLQAFIRPKETMEQQEADQIRQEFPDAFANIEGLVNAGKPQEAQKEIMGLAVRLAAQGRSTRALAPLMQATTGYRGAAWDPRAADPFGELVGMGAAAGESPNKLAGTYASGRNNLSQVDRRTALQPAELDRTRAQAEASRGNAAQSYAQADEAAARAEKTTTETRFIPIMSKAEARRRRAAAEASAASAARSRYQADPNSPKSQAATALDNARAAKEQATADYYRRLPGNRDDLLGVDPTLNTQQQGNNPAQGAPQTPEQASEEQAIAAVGADIFGALVSNQNVRASAIRERLRAVGIADAAAQNAVMQAVNNAARRRAATQPSR